MKKVQLTKKYGIVLYIIFLLYICTFRVFVINYKNKIINRILGETDAQRLPLNIKFRKTLYKIRRRRSIIIFPDHL